MVSSLYERPDLYDRLCPRLTQDDPEVAFFLSLAPANGQLLELACGTGRVAVPLAEAGGGRFAVTGLDLSAGMLAVARDSGAGVTWVEGDMCAPPLDDDAFDLAFCTLNSFLHLHERPQQEAFLAQARRVLKPGGRLVLSVVNPDVHSYARPPHARFIMLDAPDLLVEEALNYDHATQRSRGVLYFSDQERRDFFVASADLRALFPEELLALLGYNGFEVEARYGDFERGAFTSRSPLQVVVARP